MSLYDSGENLKYLQAAPHINMSSYLRVQEIKVIVSL